MLHINREILTGVSRFFFDVGRRKSAKGMPMIFTVILCYKSE